MVSRKCNEIGSIELNHEEPLFESFIFSLETEDGVYPVLLRRLEELAASKKDLTARLEKVCAEQTLLERKRVSLELPSRDPYRALPPGNPAKKPT